MIPENDYHNTPDPRIQRWGAGLDVAHQRASHPRRRPTTATTSNKPAGRSSATRSASGASIRTLTRSAKYTGVLKPKNFEIFRDFLEANHMGDQAHDFLMASGKLQALCYKEEIESALRTPGFGGFQLLDLHDFPGQGTALVGVLDPFWDEKGYITRRRVPSLLRAARCRWRGWRSASGTRGKPSTPRSRWRTSARRRWRMRPSTGRWSARMAPRSMSGKLAGGTIAPASQEIARNGRLRPD